MQTAQSAALLTAQFPQLRPHSIQSLESGEHYVFIVDDLMFFRFPKTAETAQKVGREVARRSATSATVWPARRTIRWSS